MRFYGEYFVSANSVGAAAFADSMKRTDSSFHTIR